MKGLDLCEQYFREEGMPFLERDFSFLIDRAAAGMVGDGSDCFGFDDDISRDHDWGPGFCLWLNQNDFSSFSEDLTEALRRLPPGFKGYGPRRVSTWGTDRTGVFEVGEFYSKFIGIKRVPEAADEWLMIPENNLAACTNGRVFHDPSGEFTSFRNRLLHFYPEDVRLKKIASRCMTGGQSGQYNFPRCVKRKEFFAAQYAETKFCADIISMVFLLNRKYPPFYKWMHQAVKSLALLGAWTYNMVSRLVAGRNYGIKERIIEEISLRLIEELKNQGLSRSGSTFLPDHGPEVLSRIQDADLRDRNVWVG